MTQFSNLKDENGNPLTLDLQDAGFFGATNGNANAQQIVNQIKTLAAQKGWVIS